MISATSISASERLRDERTRFALMWVIPIGVAALASFAPQLLAGGESFWRVAAGRWMLAHHAVPHTDPLTYTFAGKPWAAYGWLGDAAMAAAWLAAGWAGVALAGGLSLGLLAAVMGRWLVQWLPMAGAALALVLGLAGIAPNFTAAPLLFALPVLALWTVALLQARQAGQAPSVWLVPLMALWANLDGGFLVGPALGAGFFLETLLDVRRWRGPMLAGWAVVLGASCIAALATPQGVDGLLHAARLLHMKPGDGPWRAPNFLTLEPLELEILAGLFLLLWRGARLGAVRTLMVLGLLYGALQHVGGETALAIVTPLIAAEAFARTLSVGAPRPAPWRLPAPQMALGGALLAAVLVARVVIPVDRGDDPAAPAKALAAVPALLRAQPMLNDRDFGGYLSFAGIKPYVDGRTGLFSDGFLADDADVERGDATALSAALERWRIRWAIFHPDRGAVAAMDTLPGWRRLYTDKSAVVWEREP